jgi:hypothetical protein
MLDLAGGGDQGGMESPAYGGRGNGDMYTPVLIFPDCAAAALLERRHCHCEFKPVA